MNSFTITKPFVVDGRMFRRPRVIRLTHNSILDKNEKWVCDISHKQLESIRKTNVKLIHPLKVGDSVQVLDWMCPKPGMFPARVLMTDYDEELDTPCIEAVTEVQDIEANKEPFTAYLDNDNIWKIYDSIDNY